MVGNRKGILSRTKLALRVHATVMGRRHCQGSPMNGPTKNRTALDPAPGSQTTGVSPKHLDNADDVIHGLPDILNTSTVHVRFTRQAGIESISCRWHFRNYNRFRR